MSYTPTLPLLPLFCCTILEELVLNPSWFLDILNQEHAKGAWKNAINNKRETTPKGQEHFWRIIEIFLIHNFTSFDDFSKNYMSHLWSMFSYLPSFSLYTIGGINIFCKWSRENIGHRLSNPLGAIFLSIVTIGWIFCN